MKKLKALIIVLIALVIVIMGIIVYIRKNTDEDKKIIQNSVPFDGYDTYVPINALERVTSSTNYYTVKNIVNDYYNNIDRDYIAEEYLKEFNLNEENLNTSSISISDMLVSSETGEVSLFLVHLEVENEQAKKETSIIVGLDFKNTTFEVFPEEYLIKYGYDKLKNGDELKLTVNNIPKKQNNRFKLQIISNEKMAENYLQDFKQKLLNDDLENIYKLLDDNYKKAKFSNYKSFEDYMKNNSSRIKNAFLDKYNVSKNEGTTQYTCIDQNDNYYIFKENAIMDYTIMIDNYTIDLKEDIEEYSKLSDKEKVAASVQKYLKALEDTDYKYAYNKLGKSFKNNYFGTQEQFEEYAKNNPINMKNISQLNVENVSGEYICIVQLSGVTTNYKNPKFIVKLKTGTDFEIAFSVE